MSASFGGERLYTYQEFVKDFYHDIDGKGKEKFINLAKSWQIYKEIMGVVTKGEAKAKAMAKAKAKSNK